MKKSTKLFMPKEINHLYKMLRFTLIIGLVSHKTKPLKLSRSSLKKDLSRLVQKTLGFIVERYRCFNGSRKILRGRFPARIFILHYYLEVCSFLLIYERKNNNNSQVRKINK